jgi:hypothetical protein
MYFKNSDTPKIATLVLLLSLGATSQAGENSLPISLSDFSREGLVRNGVPITLVGVNRDKLVGFEATGNRFYPEKPKYKTKRLKRIETADQLDCIGKQIAEIDKAQAMLGFDGQQIRNFMGQAKIAPFRMILDDSTENGSEVEKRLGRLGAALSVASWLPSKKNAEVTAPELYIRLSINADSKLFCSPTPAVLISDSFRSHARENGISLPETTLNSPASVKTSSSGGSAN